ncbi:serine aminopeptidase domain-containing protein [Corallococcus sp. AS-1-12]|uniref:alpha/beta hydrolase family protein n=1 Tax=Corallococcus sp. AS-1-12 TaxID=2874598 RepID=UPI001CBFE564|nr:alpha/beta hydrolase [Corallococcus sp. AS-1-12]MBZ4332064.1 alpha/beta fold hydrolase [Corallococcus sp. AS-1-12]
MSRFSRCPSLALLISTALLTGGCASSHGTGQAAASTAVSPSSADAAYAVGLSSLTVEDAARHRSLKTVVWYPAAPGTRMEPRTTSPIFAPFLAAKDAPVSDARTRWPVVLLSHGSGGTAINMSWLGAHLAAHGFLVVSVNHPGNTYGDDSPEGYARGYERPRDFTAVLDHLLKDSRWGPRMDPERIGAAGHSMGGYTALALVGARMNLEWVARVCTAPETRDHVGCEGLRDVDYRRIDMTVARASYRDPRVKAALAMAPGMAGSYEPRDLADIHAEVGLVLAKGDELMPHEGHGMKLAGQLPAASTRSVVLDDAAHFSFLPECTPLGFQVAPALCRDAVPGTRAATHARTRMEAVEFFRRTLSVR